MGGGFGVCGGKDGERFGVSLELNYIFGYGEMVEDDLKQLEKHYGDYAVVVSRRDMVGDEETSASMHTRDPVRGECCGGSRRFMHLPGSRIPNQLRG